DTFIRSKTDELEKLIQYQQSVIEDLSRKIEENPTEDPAEDPAEDPIEQQPRARLLVAPFYCAPCESWKRQVDKLPFEVDIVVSEKTPSGSWPCLHFPVGGGKWKYWSPS